MAGSFKMPTDTFIIPTQKENGAIPDFQMQSIDPLSSIKEAYRISVFGVQRTQVVEREAEVLAVDMTIKRCSDLNYFSNQDVMTQYGTRDWVSVICRIPDFHAGTPDPDQTLAAAAGGVSPTSTFKEITRMRSCIGKFYAPMDDLRAKGITNIEVGDRVIVEFQDKTKFENGIIKEIFAKKNIATYAPVGGGGAGGVFAPGLGTYPVGTGVANVDNPSLAQEFFTMLAIMVAEGGSGQGGVDVAQSKFNRIAYANGIGCKPGMTVHVSKNIATLVNAQNQYQPTFCNKNDWRSIVDMSTADRALKLRERQSSAHDYMGGRGPVCLGQEYINIDYTGQMKRAYESLANPAFRAAAQSGPFSVGGRTDFRDGEQQEAPAGAWMPVERLPTGRYNVFFIDNNNERKLVDPYKAQDPPAGIKSLLDLNNFDQAVAMAMAGSPAGTTPPAGGTTPPAGGGTPPAGGRPTPF